MIDTNQETKETPRVLDAVQWLRAEVNKVKGSPILLRKKTRDGKPLYLQVVSKDFEVSDDDGDLAASSGLDPIRNFTSVNILTQGKNGLLPVGYYDWVIRGNVANGFGDASIWEKVKDDEEMIKLSESLSHRITSLRVLPDFQGQDIGSFMLATALVLMKRKGAKMISETVLLHEAAELWRSFGVPVRVLGPGFKPSRPISERERIPINTVMLHHKVSDTIADFISPTQKAS